MTATGMIAAGTMGAAGDEGLDPLVSADGTGFTNTRGIGGICFVGLQFNTDGEEYRILQTGAASGTSQGTWLDQGTSDQVWVEFLRSGGTKSQWDGFSNSTRYQLNVTRTFVMDDVTTGPGTETITGQFRFWDAASGGSTLDTTPAAQTWIADYEEICPMCCFTPDTLITMANGIQAPIVSIKSGDMIAVQGGTEPVTNVITQVNRVMYRVKFADGRELRMSDDHPLYVYGKGYAAFNPVGDYKDLGMAKILKLGDNVLDEHGRLNKIVDVQLIDYPQTVYTFGNSKFYANGMLVY
jgi:hypothetical protein